MAIGIIGAGAWGTALAQSLACNGRDVVLWCFEPDLAREINRTHENTLYLAGVALDPRIRATPDLAEAVAAAEAVLLATPAQHTRETLAVLGNALRRDAPLVICVKGIELGTGALMSEVARETVPHATTAVLSGPTFAHEVARGLPTAVTLATADGKVGLALVNLLGSRTLRPYLSDDPAGAQVGGAVKNVLAIACGIVTGRGLGENARAALLTRGLAELRRFALAKGGRAETVMGLSGLGDLSLTCNSARSRNCSLGIEIGRGRRVAEVLAERRTVTEGVATAAAVVALAHRLAIEMPISTAVDAIVNRGADVEATIAALLARPFRDEFDDAAGEKARRRC